MERDKFQRSWSQGLNFTFPSFSLMGWVLVKVQMEKVTLISVTPAWLTQACFPKLLEMSIQNLILLPSYPGLLTNLKREVHSLLQNEFLRLVAWKVLRKRYLQEEFQEGLTSHLQGKKNGKKS